MEIRPQPRQEVALASNADITIYGGAAGAGKSWATLVNPLRGIGTPGFSGIIFRRTTKQMRGPGGLWEESKQLYPLTGGRPRETSMEWRWRTSDPNRTAIIQLAHMEHERDRFDHQSKAYGYIAFEEATHFAAGPFWYMQSRNRTTAPGVRPWMFATCNPDPDSFIRELIDWWIDDEGYPIWSRGGELRYFIRRSGAMEWVPSDFRDEDGEAPISLTFVPASLADNTVLTEADPRYRSRLKNMPYADQQRLLHGNWNIRDGESMFSRQRVAFEPIPDWAWSKLRWVRAWDRGARDRSVRADVDQTAGALCALANPGTDEETLYIADLAAEQGKPAAVERLIRRCADEDGASVEVGLEEEYGASGKEATHYYTTRVLPDRTVRAARPTGSKTQRAKPWCALAERARVVCAPGRTATRLKRAMSSFPDGHRDEIDAISLAYGLLATEPLPSEVGVVRRKSRSSDIRRFF